LDNLHLESIYLKTNMFTLQFKTCILGVLYVLSPFCGSTQHNNEFYNDGALIHLQAGAEIHIWGDHHEMGNGTLENNGLIKVQGHSYSSATLQQTGTGNYRIENSDVNIGERQGVSGSFAVRGGQASIGVNDGSFYDLDLANDQGIVYLIGGGNIMDVRNTVDFSAGAIANRIITHDIGATGAIVYPANGSNYTGTFGLMNATAGLGNLVNNTVSLNGNLSGSDVCYVQGNFRRAISAAGGSYNYLVGLEPAGAGAQRGVQYIRLDMQPNTYDVIEGYFQSGLNNNLGAPTECGQVMNYYGGADHGQWVFSEIGAGAGSYEAWVWPQDDNFPALTFWIVTKDNSISGTPNECGPSPVARNRSSLTSIGQLGLAGNLTLLPVELLFIDSECNGQDVTISWSTSSEENNDYFTIERSVDGVHYFEIAQIPGAGSTTIQQNYSYQDFDGEGQYYYRLSQTNYNGTRTNFNAIVSSCSSTEPEISVYPNPNTGQFNVTVTGEKGDNWDLIIRDYTGKLILTKKVFAGELNTLEIGHCADGMYMLQLQSPEITITKKIIKH